MRDGIRKAFVAIVFVGIALWVHHRLLPVSNWDKATFHRDAIFQTYLLAWGSHAISCNPFCFYDPPIFWPDAKVVFSVDALELPSLLMFPVWILSKNPYLLANAMIVVSHLFAMLAAYYVGRKQFQLNRPLGVLVAILFAVSSDRLIHATGHYQLLWSGIIPLMWFSTWQLLERPRHSMTLLAAAALGLSVYFSVYLLVLAALCGAFTVLCWLLTHLKIPQRRSLNFLGLALCLGALVSAPKILLHAWAAHGINSNRVASAEASLYSATLSGYLRPASEDSLVAQFIGLKPHVQANSEDLQFIGYLLVGLMVLELVRLVAAFSNRPVHLKDKLSASAFLAASVIVLCSLGPDFNVLGISPYRVLSSVSIQFTRFYRVPARLAFVAHWFLLIPVCTLLQSPYWNNRFKTTVMASGLGMLCVLSEQVIPPQTHVKANVPPAVKVMNSADPSHSQPYVDLNPDMYLQLALADIPNWRPTVNGWELAVLSPGFDPRVLALTTDFPSTGTIGWLAENEVPWVIVRDEELLPKLNQNPELEPVATSEGPWLFRLKSLTQSKHNYKNYITSRTEELSQLRQTALPTAEVTEPQLPVSLSDESVKQLRIAGLETYSAPGSRFALPLAVSNATSQTTSMTQGIALGLYDTIEVTYQFSGSSAAHRLHLFWGTDDKVTGTRKVKAKIKAPRPESPNWTATFDLTRAHNWYADEGAIWAAIQFDRFKGPPPQSIEVLNIKQKRQRLPVHLPPIDAVP